MDPDVVARIARTLTSIIVPLLVGWLLFGARRQAQVRVRDERLVLVYGIRLRILALFFLLFGGFMMFVVTKAPPEERVTAVVVVGALVVIIAVFAIEVFRVRVEFGADDIRCFSPWRSNRVVPWGAVKSIAFSSGAQWWMASTQGHGGIRLHQFLTGVGDFIAAAKARGITVETALPHGSTLKR